MGNAAEVRLGPRQSWEGKRRGGNSLLRGFPPGRAMTNHPGPSLRERGTSQPFRSPSPLSPSLALQTTLSVPALVLTHKERIPSSSRSAFTHIQNRNSFLLVTQTRSHLSDFHFLHPPLPPSRQSR
ncbi:hypothetical protein IE53DRAFT_244032 [Violaceomyces palustris]|uniref:Uncharacterized protein n=1 Tax=Violaceomyces palustris TaxID=1673888 RepID=A0ACD0NP17_9BASI|nr:hypothetical protein IE53DRAFT_244032 [Violaceomyces palustris]